MKRHIDRIKDAVYGRGYVYSLHYHIVWCTKYRRPCFTTKELADEMKDILFRIADRGDIDIQEMEVMPDHIHILCSFKPRYSITNVVKDLKGSSGRLFFQSHSEIRDSSFWDGRLWAPSYYVSSVGNMNKDTIKRYIKNQYDGLGGDSSPKRQIGNSSRQ